MTEQDFKDYLSLTDTGRSPLDAEARSLLKISQIAEILGYCPVGERDGGTLMSHCDDYARYGTSVPSLIVFDDQNKCNVRYGAGIGKNSDMLGPEELVMSRRADFDAVMTDQDFVAGVMYFAAKENGIVDLIKNRNDFARDFSMMRSNMFEFASGDYGYVDYDRANDQLVYGGATNAGFYPEFDSAGEKLAVDIDYAQSLDYNLEGLYDRVVEAHPEFATDPGEEQSPSEGEEEEASARRGR